MSYSVLLDTSFFIRLLNPNDKLHKNTVNYYKYFLDRDIILKVSTISIAEYCVRGKIDELPLKTLQIIPFNLDHAQRAGRFANILFTNNKNNREKLKPRTIIPNDSKLFAQADIDKSVEYFVTSDAETKKVINSLKSKISLEFEIIDIAKPYNEEFGVLDLG